MARQKLKESTNGYYANCVTHNVYYMILRQPSVSSDDSVLCASAVHPRPSGPPPPAGDISSADPSLRFAPFRMTRPFVLLRAISFFASLRNFASSREILVVKYIFIS